MTTRRLIFVACLLTALAVSAPAAGQLRVYEPIVHAPVQTLAAMRASHAAAARRQEDPYAKVYLVTSRALFEGGVGTHARKLAVRRDGIGNDLVIAETRTWQLPEISHGIHERERHCGGYFAFPTRAEAEAFLRAERSVKALRAKAADYGIDNAATVAPWLPLVQEANIRGTIQHLSTAWPNRYYASPHGHNAALWIRDTWAALGNGRPDVSVELFTACNNCGGQPSVILTVRGNELPNEIVVVGGHLDSINIGGGGNNMNAPGADDDASGIATITEILRVALASGWKPKRTLKFMGYSAEEVGLRGSNAIAQSFRSQGLDVVGVLQLDMTNNGVASPYAMRLMTDNSNPTLQNFVTRLFDAYLAPLGMSRGTDTCGYACSDHASWTSAGYPAAMMAEPTFFDRLHTNTDTLAYMSNSAAVSVNFAKLGLAFVGELGKTHVLRRGNGSQPLAPASSGAAAASSAPPIAVTPATHLPLRGGAWRPLPYLSTRLRSRLDP